jgi:hypothetical protein
MATLLKRITISLQPELEKVLDDLREATGVAPASFISSLLLEALPVLQATVRAAQLSKSNQAEALRVMSDAMSSALHAGTTEQMEIITMERKLRKTALPTVKRKKATNEKS